MTEAAAARRLRRPLRLAERHKSALRRAPRRESLAAPPQISYASEFSKNRWQSKSADFIYGRRRDRRWRPRVEDFPTAPREEEGVARRSQRQRATAAPPLPTRPLFLFVIPSEAAEPTARRARAVALRVARDLREAIFLPSPGGRGYLRFREELASSTKAYNIGLPSSISSDIALAGNRCDRRLPQTPADALR